VNRAANHTILSPFRAGLILGVTTIFGAALRLHQLSAKSFWIDEGASVSFATIPLRPFLYTLWSYQGNMALYYFLLRAWIHFGDSEFVVRSLSVLFAVLTIPAIYFLGKRLFDRTTGLTAAVLLSVHSFHVQWSQEARGYSLLTLLLVLAAYFLICAMESKEESLGYWIAFTVTAALSFYAHIFAGFVLATFAPNRTACEREPLSSSRFCSNTSSLPWPCSCCCSTVEVSSRGCTGPPSTIFPSFWCC
jgi:mannosyltransferase